MNTPIDKTLSALEQAEPLFLVTAGGDGYHTEIVPQSRLDDAYLLTQWGDLASIDPKDRAEALEHFHHPDSWIYQDPLHGGRDCIQVEFSISFEDGWVRVVRLPDALSDRAPAPALHEQAPSEEQHAAAIAQIQSVFDEEAERGQSEAMNEVLRLAGSIAAKIALFGNPSVAFDHELLIEAKATLEAIHAARATPSGEKNA